MYISFYKVNMFFLLQFYDFLFKQAGLTDSRAPGKSGISAGWKALRALSDAPGKAHVIPCKRRANILQSAWYLPEARIIHLRSRPKYKNILRMSSEPASQLSSEDKAPLLINQGFICWSCGGAHTHSTRGKRNSKFGDKT